MMSPTRRFIPAIPAYFWFLLALAPMPASADTVRVYVTNSAGDSVRSSIPRPTRSCR